MNLMKMFELATVTVFSEICDCIWFSPLTCLSPRYNATLGHKVWSLSIDVCYNLNREDTIPNLKVNHSFEPNSEFILFSAHPVLGTVMALAAMEDMVAGQELTVNYGYVGNCRQMDQINFIFTYSSISRMNFIFTY